jgi:hypothetical protein
MGLERNGWKATCDGTATATCPAVLYGPTEEFVVAEAARVGWRTDFDQSGHSYCPFHWPTRVQREQTDG